MVSVDSALPAGRPHSPAATRAPSSSPAAGRHVVQIEAGNTKTLWSRCPHCSNHVQVADETNVYQGTPWCAPAGMELRALITRPAQPASRTGFRSTIGCDARRSPRKSFPVDAMAGHAGIAAVNCSCSMSQSSAHSTAAFATISSRILPEISIASLCRTHCKGYRPGASRAHPGKPVAASLQMRQAPLGSCRHPRWPARGRQAPTP